MPHQVLPSHGQLTVNYTMFEADQVPPEWVARGRSHDLVIVPTPSSRDAWQGSGYPPGQLRVCPLGVDVDRFHPAREPLPHGRRF
jgi:hypothetical protein